MSKYEGRLNRIRKKLPGREMGDFEVIIGPMEDGTYRGNKVYTEAEYMALTNNDKDVIHVPPLESDEAYKEKLRDEAIW